MRKKNKVTTTVSLACTKVKGFAEIYRRFERRMCTLQRSEATKKNYSRYIAQIALHYKRLPTLLTFDEIEDYLEWLIINHKPSYSYFKSTVYSLRFLFRIENLNEKRILLPAIKQNERMPIVLGKDEVKAIIAHATNFKHKLLVELLYGCGLRCCEVRSIRICDIDLSRGMLLVRRKKGYSDRYLPLGRVLVRRIKQYLKWKGESKFLFTGIAPDSMYSQKGVQLAVKSMCKNAGIRKEVSPHTFRHTYATHLLEDGLDIVSIKELLGHSSIRTTMIYLHIARVNRKKPFSILDNLYKKGNRY